eukprot:gb/GECG01009598.1/.p1 GENE.gb/GECG01009598.1/~~gb/GECG01009598.1/.p1  ORF type:complete len:178 (+),score=10.99 gb/GECG01009598.1/:1-534(+)
MNLYVLLCLPCHQFATMESKGSCRCGRVKFTVQLTGPAPFMVCNCSRCVKCQGPWNPNLLGDTRSFRLVEGPEFVKTYQAREEDGSLSNHERKFCSECGSHLWAFDSRWPDVIHPVASAIDTELPVPPCYRHIMMGDKKTWIPASAEQMKIEQAFERYPDKSLEQWHKEKGMYHPTK